MAQRNKRMEKRAYKRKLKREVEIYQRKMVKRGYLFPWDGETGDYHNYEHGRDLTRVHRYQVSDDARRAGKDNMKAHRKVAKSKLRRVSNEDLPLGKSNYHKKVYSILWEIS